MTLINDEKFIKKLKKKKNTSNSYPKNKPENNDLERRQPTT